MSHPSASLVAKPIPLHWDSQPSFSLIASFSRELEKERAKNLALLNDLVAERRKIEVLEAHITRTKIAVVPSGAAGAWSSIGSLLDDSREDLSGRGIEKEIGLYSTEIRRQKIEKYKKKQMNHRAKIAVNREYAGRSNVARAKHRVNGRFFRPGEE